ncbi:effector binding domain-containing protein [Listeria cossartiae subsp. cayugensis]|uniref:GyrI-like domain-containing protein n=1 Tax=Listeria cossartiae TaxID=2838249 RepID=UPI0028805E21|nr:effector binding domain-containing protein [Listeria cossartiae]MDS9999336.1 effector binding domain-containing protein [Listeria cossartiae subsp. cayugensis]MDT0008217.1 effector binding domain-containing protein [Listeria cossartiae subsp. cayugensis]MDT0029368.1 effector binding domain-containing protein [Listeria cossartiae subsp. cayugensis]MDT0037483.1 effector binding domain-containing protein [Listeria cossartiae subsp. cayugensis]MDT0042833.1 effector binding domain-containing pro
MAIRLKRLEEWEGFTGIALVQEGLKTEALHTEIRKTFQEMLQLAQDLDDFSEQETFYGISVHNIEDGITHYSVIPVEQKYPNLKEPLEWIEVPAHTYFVAEHIPDTDIIESYEEIARAIQEKNYKPYITANNPVFDPLPFKLELYTKNADDKASVEIRIPVVKELHT